MTCKKCEVAGYIAEELEPLEPHDPVYHAIQDMVERWHRQCEEDGCTCRHIV